MHLSLNVKFILAYIAFAILSFVGISTLTSRLMLDNATRTRASSFYQEGVYLSNQYVETYFDEETTKGTVSRIQTQLSSLSVYLNAHIWLVSREGDHDRLHPQFFLCSSGDPGIHIRASQRHLLYYE